MDRSRAMPAKDLIVQVPRLLELSMNLFRKPDITMKSRTPWAKPLSLAALAVACAAPQLASAACKTTAVRMGEILGNIATPDTLTLAHRGLWGANAQSPGVPENSRASLREAQNACMDGVELDVKVTKDGMPVLMHDFNVGRTTNASAVLGGLMYNPYTNHGTNPRVDSLTWAQVQGLQLLTQDRKAVTGYHPPSVPDLFDYWKSNFMSVPMVFDTKDAGAVRAVHTAALQKFSRPGDVVAVKVNATLFPTPLMFIANAKYISAIPVFTTNMLTKIDVPASRRAWQDWANTLEINVKQDGGLLQGQMDQAKRTNRIGVFQAIPDAGGDRFFSNDGHCCYRLQDLYFSYAGGRDTADHRGDRGYLLYQGFGLITTDDPRGMNAFLAAHAKRLTHPQ